MKIFWVWDDNIKKINIETDNSVLEEETDSGQIALDILETLDMIIIYAPIAGIELENIEKIFQQGGFSPLSLSWKKIWLSLRDYNVENFEEKIIEIIKYLLENNAEIILIPHSFHKTDIKANDYIFLKKCRDVSLKHLNNNSESSSELQNKISICKNMQESYRIYTEKKIDLNLASRLHSIILSQVYEIDFIWISYSTKTDEVISQLSNQNQDI